MDNAPAFKPLVGVGDVTLGALRTLPPTVANEIESSVAQSGNQLSISIFHSS